MNRPLISAISFLGILLAFIQSDSKVNAQRLIRDGSTSTNIVDDIFEGRDIKRIIGGEQRGELLFHSFEEFNVDTSSDVFFDALNSSTGEEIASIFSRVTGNNPSDIYGRLGVIGNADLFFVNPNGIFFNSNTSLQLNGSFVASTAESIVFDEDFAFSAEQANTIPLELVVNVPTSLLFREPASIFSDGASFQVSSGNEIALIGGDISLINTIISSQGSFVTIGAVGDNGSANIKFSSNRFSVDYENIDHYGSTILEQTSIITPPPPLSSISSGDVTLFGDPLSLGLGTAIFSTKSPFDPGNSGNITLYSPGLIELTEVVAISSTTVGRGNAGDILFKSSELTIGPETSIRAGTLSNADGGDIKINSDVIDVDAESGFITLGVSTLGLGMAGNISIKSNTLSLRNGVQILSETFEDGAGGDIDITANNSIDISAQGLLSNGEIFPSGLSSRSFGAGNAGNININAGNFSLRDGAFISTSAEGTGDAGNILVITAEDLKFDNNALIDSQTSAETIGDRGNINLFLRDLILRRGSRISTDASGQDPGGNIRIDVDNLVALENSDITANAINNFGGTITINAEGILGTEFRDRLTPESDITASSALGPQFSGLVKLNTPDLDPSNNLESLPDTVVDIDSLVSASPCPEGFESEFVVEGSGGIPSSPGNTLSPEGLIPTDLAEPVDIPDRDSESSFPSDSFEGESIAQAAGVTPAWGWVWNDKGEVLLTAHDPAEIASQRLPSHSGLCSGH
ncbi:MAG: filamentous hemagglutinin N-terminal domain-containing protein [Synechococcus sp.]